MIGKADTDVADAKATRAAIFFNQEDMAAATEGPIK